MNNINPFSFITNVYSFDRFEKSRETLVERTSSEYDKPPYGNDFGSFINSRCKDIINNSNAVNKAYITDKDEKGEPRYKVFKLPNYDKFRRKQEASADPEDNRIFEIEMRNGDYTFLTGKYVGLIDLNITYGKSKMPLLLDIRIPYSDELFFRMLQSMLGFHFDRSVSDSSKKTVSANNVMIQYAYILSLKSVINTIIPKKYNYPKERGYSIRGNIDINSYVNYDLTAFDKKITYRYPERVEIQPIIDTLYAALKKCHLSNTRDVLPEIMGYESYLREHASRRPPSAKMVQNILHEKCLQNSLYAGYKMPLYYAQTLIMSDDISSGGKKRGMSNFLIDSSFLWETYLYNLMFRKLPSYWEIDPQYKLQIYNTSFFATTNYPDFVLHNNSTDEYYILDAKFKKMDYEKNDVDNDDLQQVHSYSYYFALKYGNKFKGTALIYPTKKEKPDDLVTVFKMFNIREDVHFGILTLKDPEISKGETMVLNEERFINELCAFLGK